MEVTVENNTGRSHMTLTAYFNRYGVPAVDQADMTALIQGGNVCTREGHYVFARLSADEVAAKQARNAAAEAESPAFLATLFGPKA